MKCPYCIKKCSKCGKLLVANTMNFRKKKDGKYGLRAECKQCKSKLDKEYRQNNLEEIRKKDRERNRHLEDERKEYIKKYREEHKEEISEQRKVYYENNKEKIKKYNKEYNKDNPHIKFNSDSKRRELKENQGSGITKEQWFDMMMFFDFKCAYSGVYIGGNSEYRTIDHIVSLNKNGEHEIWNCVPMHLSYNSSKRVQDMLEWYQKQDFYSEERLNKIYEWIEYAKRKYQK